MPAFGSKLVPLALTLLVSLFAPGGAAMAAVSETLILYTWPDYINPDLIKRFHKETGIQVKEVHYETDQTKEELLLTTAGEGMDLIIGSAFSLRNHVKQQWLAPLDRANLPNLGQIDRQWIDQWKSVENHAVPILWGTIGIAYRADKVTRPVQSWLDLYRPDAALKGHILMIQDVRETVGMAMKALGYSANDNDPRHLEEVANLLQAQRPFVHSFGYPQLDEESELLKGDVWMAMIYNGDALALRELDANVRFVVPKEGSAIWLDSIAVFAQSTRQASAHRFINFLLEPKNAAANSEYLNFATTNRGAWMYLSDSHRNNPLIYPDPEVLARSESLAPMDADYMRKINQIFATVLQTESR